MEENTLMEKVAKLPDSMKLKVSEFIDFLLENKLEFNEGIKHPVFGSGKGMFKMKPGFDEPLEDFKDYL